MLAWLGSLYLFAGVTACGPMPNQSQIAENEKASGLEVRPYSHREKLELMEALSGSQIAPPRGTPGQPFKERFFADGVWEGEFAQTDVNHYGGTWELVEGPADKLEICFQILSMNGVQIEEDRSSCRAVGIDGNGLTYIANLLAGGDQRVVEMSPIN